MFHHRLADFSSAAVEDGENTFRHTRGPGGGDHGVGHDFRNSGMRRVRHHNDGTTGGQGGRGVATGHRIGEREIAGTENRHRTERAEHGAVVGLGQRLAVRLGAVDAGIHPGAFLDLFRKHPELADGTTRLSTKSRLGQRGLELATLHDVLHRSFDPIRYGLKEHGAGFSG